MRFYLVIIHVYNLTLVIILMIPTPNRPHYLYLRAGMRNQTMPIRLQPRYSVECDVLAHRYQRRETSKR